MVSSDSELQRPLIGLTTYLQRAQTGVWDVQAAFLPEVYFAAVEKAGGIPVLLPPQPVEGGVAEQVLSRLDGLIIAGGLDVDAARYGATAHPENDRPSPLRDDWDDALLTAAITAEVPFLAICRGIQVLNVLRGGTLHQHLPEVVGDDRFRAGNGEFAVNEVRVQPESRIAAVIGEGSHAVQSYHHQAIDAVGSGLRVTAQSDDGIVQAVELEDVPFGVGVQWHPEQDAEEDARLFEGLVEAARSYRKLHA
ncbi:gamma-glutamyl-gamma-aminobutyrate hydrolase family protein [Lysinimonas soli]|uniref:Gamma-glutamyl-gamma-aminobutyrate hydrolase family protein n=1 Tax=Lysinimonas soli TaxID=1074233 RepID=A0ABW0NS83_9MICO